MLIRTFILTILLLLAAPPLSVANELLIIAAKNYSEKHINKKKITNIFLRKQLINQQGKRWVPVNLSPQHPLRMAFSELFFDQQPEEMDDFWNIKYFQGFSPPYVVNSQEAMLRFVVSTPNAIGYVSPCFVNENVKVIFKIRIKAKMGFKSPCK